MRYVFLVLGVAFILFGINSELGLIQNLSKNIKQEVVSSATSQATSHEVKLDDQFPFILEIPVIRFRGLVCQGANPEVLKYTLGVWRGSFGQSSVWIAGHRSLPFFWRLPELKIGDTIIIKLSRGEGERFVFSVFEIKVICPDDSKMIQEIDKISDLVLFTCHPPGIATKRVVVMARKERK